MFSAMSDSLLNHGAKVWRKTIGCSTCRQLVMEMSPTCYIYLCINTLQSQKQSIKHGDYCILLNIRQIGGALYIYWTWNCGRIMGAMLGTVKEMNHRGRTPTTVYSFTVLQFYSFHKRFLTFEPIFYIYNIYIFIYIYIYNLYLLLIW